MILTRFSLRRSFTPLLDPGDGTSLGARLWARVKKQGLRARRDDKIGGYAIRPSNCGGAVASPASGESLVGTSVIRKLLIVALTINSSANSIVGEALKSASARPSESCLPWA
jgi:hypothetical protein